MKQLGTSVLLLLGIAIICVIVGCSGDRPTGPDTSVLPRSIDDNGFPRSLDSGDPVEFAARVQTTNHSQRMLTFYGVPDTVIAAHECEIVRLKSGVEAPIPFTDIQPHDSMKVCGVRQQNNYVLAYRLRVYGCGDFPVYDLAFRDTITSIDYGANSFTVAGRTETITVDEHTLIWGCIITAHPGGYGPLGDPNDASQILLKAEPDPGQHRHRLDTLLTLTDLQVGDVVEVKANIVDESTLLALVVKLTCYSNRTCVEFTATLASVDCDERVVTFEGLDWIGLVCPGAILLDAEGEILTLCDFSAGDNVSVKGFPLEDGTLKICRMVLESQ